MAKISDAFHILKKTLLNPFGLFNPFREREIGNARYRVFQLYYSTKKTEQYDDLAEFVHIGGKLMRLYEFNCSPDVLTHELPEMLCASKKFGQPLIADANGKIFIVGPQTKDVNEAIAFFNRDFLRAEDAVAAFFEDAQTPQMPQNKASQKPVPTCIPR